MAQVKPFRSSKRGSRVYHDNDACTEGNNTEGRYRVAGTGGRRLCARCRRLEV